ESDCCRDLAREMACALNQLTQRRPAHQLDDEVALFITGVRYVVHLDDAGVLDPRYGARLAHEAGGDLAVFAQMTVNDLYRHVAPESFVARAIASRHTAVTDLFE